MSGARTAAFRWTKGFRGLAGASVVLGIGLGLYGLWLGGFLGPVFGFAGLALVFASGLLVHIARTRGGYDWITDARMIRLVAGDPEAWFATDGAGRIVLRNQAAETRLGDDCRSITQALSRHVLEPGQLFLRLQTEATMAGSARQDLSGPDGSLRVTVRRTGRNRFLWRIETFPDPAGSQRQILPERVGPEPWVGGLDGLPVPLMILGRDGVVRQANRQARDLLLRGEGETAVFHDLFDGPGRPVSDWLADVISGRLPGGTEVLRARRIEGDRFMQVTLTRHDDEGRPGAVAVIQDATRLKALEAQVVQSQKMQAIGQLAGGIAHDFNNLLTAISGHCDLMALRHDPEDADYADLQQIRQNANRAAALVGQLLAFSRKQTLQPETIDPEELLSDLTHLLNRLIGEKVGLRLAQSGRALGKVLRPIRADRRQLEQVVVNLVINARDAMPEGGEVVIETEPVTLVSDLHRDRAVVPAGDYTVIRVIDRGIGISAENRKRIFEPFFTTKRPGEGTGLGLSMAYGIIKQSGGFIFADSTLGEGTTFALYFPAQAVDAKPVEKPAARPRSVRQRAGVVLLVEDEAPVRAFAGRALRMRGYTVLEAETAEDALKTLADGALEVDIFVTDVMMPGMDGPSWVREALRSRPNTPVIFMSGYAEDVLNNDQGGLPDAVFLPKPFSLQDLTLAVQTQLQ